ncbi:MAG: hypothetical protein RL745_386 [Actinomycetota bacterium]
MHPTDGLCGVKQTLVSLVRDHAAARPDSPVDAHLVTTLVASQRLMLPPERRHDLIGEVLDDVIGAGPLAPLLRIDGVSDVVVNRHDRVYVDVGNGLERAAVTFADDAAVRDCAARLARLAGRRLDDAHPFVDARLPTGERLHAVLSSVSVSGTLISIRVPRKTAMTWSEVSSASFQTERQADSVIAAVGARESILISGGTGSGKTTLLNALLGECAPMDRIIVVEDTTELAPAHPHVVQMECKPPNAESAGGVALSDLVRHSLRMRPDRLVVGEVRGAEVVDLLMALNTGHTGSMATIHANRPADVPARIEVLAATSGLSRQGLMQAIASAFGLVVHMDRDRAGKRYVREVARVTLNAGELTVYPC